MFAEEALAHPLALAALLETDPDSYNASSVLWLPAIARPYLAEWIGVAFSHWRLTAQETFPETADWHHAAMWASPQEIAARTALADFEAAEAARRQAADVERNLLLLAQDEAEEKGQQWRALLVATADPLVRAVQEALETLGFEVVQSDELPQHLGKKREDLRVIDDSWTALVEVKGYTGAAKSNDLLQIASAATTFGVEEGRAPDSLWYIPNTQREIDPGQRALPLAGREDDVAAFADLHHGCVIDSRQLFALRQTVALGELARDEARDILKNASGRLAVTSSHG